MVALSDPSPEALGARRLHQRDRIQQPKAAAREKLLAPLWTVASISTPNPARFRTRAAKVFLATKPMMRLFLSL